MLNLDAIQARIDATHEGPQRYWPGQGITPATGVLTFEGASVTVLDGAMTSADGEFIAHAYTDVPALVAELRAAREAKQRLVKVLEYASYPDPDLESLRRIMAEWDEALDKLAGGEG